MLKNSWWPVLSSISLISMFSSLLIYAKWSNEINLLISLLTLILCIFFWLTDVNFESNGFHIPSTIECIKLGMLLFILSEVMFFSGLFWSWIHVSVSPDVSVGMVWPPVGITPLSPWGIPLLNSIILLSSGGTVTWAHHALVNNMDGTVALFLTIFLGVWFTCIQLMEYSELTFSMSDSCYGSCFLIATGFHGFHVILGTLMLSCCFLMMLKNNYDSLHHTSFECVSLYWHMVDVVWLGLYMLVYCWGY